jgi:hypothetical protein
MKKISVVLLFLLVQIGAFADCGPAGLYLFPMQQEIAPSSVFMIEGTGFDAKMALRAGQFYDLFLVAGETKIKLIVDSNFQQENGRTVQVFLSPETALEANESYELQVKEDSEMEGQPYALMAQHRHWKTSLSASAALPIFEMSPEISRKGHQSYSSDNSTFCEYDYLRSTDQESLMCYEIKYLKSGKKLKMYTAVGPSSFMIGHAMCGSGFEFEEEETYEIRFSLVTYLGQHIRCEQGWTLLPNPMDDK